MGLSRSFCIVASFCTILNLASSSPLTLHEKRHEFGDLYRGDRIKATSFAKFKIGLKQSNLEYVYDHLLNISHPSSPYYGKLWSADDVHETFAPQRESVGLVREWLESSGIENVTERNGWLHFDSDIAHIEDLLQAEYHEYDGFDSRGVRIGCDQYHLPEHLSEHIDFVVPGVALSAPMQRREVPHVKRGSPSPPRPHLYGPHPLPWKPYPKNPPPGSGGLPRNLQRCGHTITPDCIRALYDIPSPKEIAASYDSSAVNSLGVFEGFGTYNQTDLNKFFSVFAKEVPEGTHPIGQSINGARIPQGNHRPVTNTETALDIQIMYSLVYPQTVTLYEVAETVEGVNTEGYSTFSLAIEELLDALDKSFCSQKDKAAGLDCGKYDPTRVISISYGTAEIHSPQAYLQRQCQEFAKLGLQGVTFTVSSGDWGVAAQGGYVKVGKNDYEGTNGCIVAGDPKASTNPSQGGAPSKNGTVFSGQYPQTCPYVLSVGATRLYNDQTILDPESSMVIPGYGDGGQTFTTGGGFSNYFPRPSYQDKTIKTYFADHDPGYKSYNFNGIDFSKKGSNIGANGGVYNRIGRGFPDVSANGLNFPIIYEGSRFREGGTSQAAPIWGSIITLINEKRTQAGKGPVGFINPVLYENPQAFHDIVNGTNPGCFTEGFPAVTGWDPNTGLGTPNYPKLLDIFLNLP